MPPGLRGHPYSGIVAFSVFVIIFFGIAFTGPANVSLGLNWLIFCVVVLGFYFTFGVSGQFAFGQASLMGVGSYTSVLVTEHFHFLGIPGALIAAIAAAGLVALVFGLLAGRASHFYFAIASLGLAELLLTLFGSWTGFAGSAGERLDVPPPSIGGWVLASQNQVLYLALIVLVVGLVLGTWLERSPMKREALAVRDLELVSASLGLPVARIRLKMLVLGSCYAGAAGYLLVAWQGLVDPSSYGVDVGIALFLMLVLGGRGSMWGGFAGRHFMCSSLRNSRRASIRTLSTASFSWE